MEHVVALRDGLRELMKVVRCLKQKQQLGNTGILAVIERNQRLHLKDLAAACALDQSTTSRAVSALVLDGLVRRVADPHDGRATFLELTGAGREALGAAEERYTALLGEVLRDWPPAEAEALAALTHKLAQSFVHSNTLEATR